MAIRTESWGISLETVEGCFLEIGAEAIKIESRTNLLFSFEKMAIRDALKSERGARNFAEGLYALLYAPESLPTKFDRWCEVVASLPPQAESSTYLASSNCIRIHCPARNSHLPKTNRNPLGRQRIRF